MRDLSKVTPAEVLAVPEGQPEGLFSGPADFEAEYKAAAKSLRPKADAGDKAANDAFARLNLLHDAARRLVKDGHPWPVPNTVILRRTDGTTSRIRYRRAFADGPIKGYVSKTMVTWLLPPDLAPLAPTFYEQATRSGRPDRFADDRMRAEIQPHIGRPKWAPIELVTGEAVIVVEKEPESIRLADLAQHMGGKVPPVHAAWIVSRLHGLCCWLEWAGLTHNDISPNTAFVRPSTHRVDLLGGWGFAAAAGSKLGPLQQARTVDNMPPSVLATKMANILTDLSLARLTGREILGDPIGTGLAAGGVPAPMAEWLRSVPSGRAVDNMGSWMKALEKSFGPRKFIDLKVSFDDVYGRGGASAGAG